METLKTYLEALQFACHSKACAPPPVGPGGSLPSKGGGGGGGAPQSAAGRHEAVRKSLTTADDEVDSEAVRKAKMVAQARQQGYSPNVSRSTPGASRVAEDAGEVMAEVLRRSKINPDTREDGLPGKEHGEDQLLSAIYEARGFNKHAQQLDAADFEEFLKANSDTHVEAWRGIDTGPVMHYTNEFQRENAARIAMSFHEGEVHWAGRGILGNGTYFATNHPDSQEGFNKSMDESRRYSNKQNTVQIHAALDMENFAEYDSISRIGTVVHKLTNMSIDGKGPPADQWDDTPAQLLARGVEGRNYAQWEKMTDREVAMGMEVVRQGLAAGMSLSEIHTVTKDAGRLSAVIGYDGLSTKTMPGMGQSEYTVVHNRGAVILDHTIYNSTLKDPGVQYPTHTDEKFIESHPAWNDESQRSR